MMGLIDTFEQTHMREFHAYESVELPPCSFKTPDGQEWNLAEVIKGWQPRVSDRWAITVLHCWIFYKKIQVRHVELPHPLEQHSPVDPAWAFIENKFGPGEREAEHLFLGRADFTTDNLHVEFGTCCPAKFVINLGLERCDHMIVPYGKKYAFVFTPETQLFKGRCRDAVT